MARKFQALIDKMPAAARAEVEAHRQAVIGEMPLQQLRRAREFTQTTLAETMGIQQGEVSKIEQRTDVYVSTLRSYVEALGGELEIVAHFADGDVRITQFHADTK